MNKKFLLTPSIYCADTTNFYTEIKKLQTIGINWIHFDVMDGVFVQNYGLGPKQLNDIKKHYPNLTIDVHIMGINLFNKLPLFVQADYITFHWASVKDYQEANELITIIKQQHCKVGIALDLLNDIFEISDLLSRIDLITIMAIKPGFVGQSFEPIVWQKIKKIKILKQ
ncbi:MULTISPECIES: ribulose-phosphate 3-epimerase [Spiroplasma]|uniref:ribulose-phosphate 3-epimerase n=1 Tax=Spiroplasma TaxID=2132 RepID=UPI001F4CF373|nr:MULTISPECIES: ribulose-phosphate 3-epimerase [Spiroplasma]UNF62085.1 ribulose-phosphate 3-epimerase [Spiroplasma poulsonii]